jgi:putative Mg2+ transporter-C (MgtC) family protein
MLHTDSGTMTVENGRRGQSRWDRTSLELRGPERPMLDVSVRLALAALLALPLGWERERRSRSAGLRTYPLLSLCVCGFLLLGQKVAWGASEQADVFYGVLTGIGFVGSGAIMKSTEDVAGIGTAVSLWVTGAIGAGVAYGGLLLSATLSLMSLLGLWMPSLVKSRAS